MYMLGGGKKKTEKAPVTGRYCIVFWRRKHLVWIIRILCTRESRGSTGPTPLKKNGKVTHLNQRKHFWPNPQVQNFSACRMLPIYGPWGPFGSVGRRIPTDYCYMLSLVRRYLKNDDMGRRMDTKTDHRSRVHYFTCGPLASVFR